MLNKNILFITIPSIMGREICFYCKKQFRLRFIKLIDISSTPDNTIKPHEPLLRLKNYICSECEPIYEKNKCSRCKNYRHPRELDIPYERCYRCHSMCHECKWPRRNDEMNYPDGKCYRCFSKCSSCKKYRKPDEMNYMHNKCLECHNSRKITVICCLIHDKCLNKSAMCCHCSDTRDFLDGYESYVDGVGHVMGASRNQFYCPSCSRHKIIYEETMKDAVPAFKAT